MSASGKQFIRGLLRKRHQLKLAIVRSRSTTRGMRRFESQLRWLAQDPSPKRIELPPLAIRRSDGRDIAFLSRPLVLETKSRFVREVPGAHIITSAGIIFTRGRRFVTENVYGDEEATLRHGACGAFVRSFSRSKSRLGIVFSLLGPYSHNYFHWLNDHLPRVEDFLLWRATYAPDARLLLAPGPWQIEFLELLGVGRDLWVTYPLHHATAKLAAVSPYPGYSVGAHPGLLQGVPWMAQVAVTPERLAWLRSRIFASLDLKETPGTRRLFISRRGSARRPLVNEEEIARALEGWGFEPVFPSELKIKEQVRVFAGAAIVVAAHGAGLANLVFSTAPTVIELFPEDWVRPHFQALTIFTGGKHVGVFLQGSSRSSLGADVGGLMRVLEKEFDTEHT
jgi:hypothetical protein